MTWPVGTVISLLKKQGMVGCLSNLYNSIENLNDSYILPNQKKDSLLKPTPSVQHPEFPLLLEHGHGRSADFQLYGCSSNCGVSSRFHVPPVPLCPCVTDVIGALCTCGKTLNVKVPFIAGNAAATGSPSEGGFVKGVATYMVMDDLTVQPMSSISSIVLLNKLNIKDIGSLQEKVVNFGMDEALKLLKASLCSKTVLTAVFLDSREGVV